MEVKDKVNELICNGFWSGDKQQQIEPTADLFIDLGADSLDIIELAMALEMEFGITIKEETWMGWKTVGEVHETVAILLLP